MQITNLMSCVSFVVTHHPFQLSLSLPLIVVIERESMLVVLWYLTHCDVRALREKKVCVKAGISIYKKTTKETLTRSERNLILLTTRGYPIVSRDGVGGITITSYRTSLVSFQSQQQSSCEGGEHCNYN